jgi:DNA-binding GntR family transcriptional regulator
MESEDPSVARFEASHAIKHNGAGPDMRFAGGAAWQLESGSVPLYLKAARLIERQIGEGRLAVGALLPTEFDLAGRLGVSRRTVRQAIAPLRSQGLLSARKGVGTRVEARQAPSRNRYSAQTVADLVDFARETDLHIFERGMIAARGRLAAKLGCRPGTAPGDLALEVTRRSLASGRRLVEHATMLLPADRYFFCMSFRADPV